VTRVALRVSWVELTQFQEAIRAQRRDMMSRERIKKEKMETKRRRYTLTAGKAGHASLFYPELPRRGQLLMSTVWHVGRVTTSAHLRSLNEIITEYSGSNTVRTGDRRPGMALLSTRRETS